MTGLEGLRVREHFGSTGKWLLWTMVFGLAPLWLMVLLLWWLGEIDRAPDLVVKGQLALYTAAMSATALHLTSIDRDPPGMRFRTTINTVVGIALLVAIFGYGAVESLTRIESRFHVAIPLNGAAIVTVTSISYLAATGVAFLATWVDSARLDRRFSDLQAAGESRLQRRFRDEP